MPSLRAALEEAIFANPDDLAAHMAYADLLAEQGDPRGEFIQVQLALEDPACRGARRKQLQAREQELLETHQRDWLGPLAEHIVENDVVAWRRGWLNAVSLRWLGLEAIRGLVRCPVASILRKLDLCHVGYENDYDPDPEDGIPTGSEYPCLYPLQKASFVEHLRWLRVGEEVDFEEEMYNSHTSGEGLPEFVARTPHLEELHVLAHSLETEKLFPLTNLDRLRFLLVYHSQEVYRLDVLAANPSLRSLETIRMHPAHGYPDEEVSLPRHQVVHLLHSPHLPALRHLHLHGSDLGDEGCVEIVRSGILKRLHTLDLRHGCITDSGARMLAACPDTRNLKHLSLADNQLTEEGIGLLRGLDIDVRVDFQHEVGSYDYLWTGDME